MKGKQQDFRTEKYIRYGIRKYSFGAASVAIAAGLMFLGNGAVSATEQNPVSDSKENIQKVENPSPELGESNIQLTEKTAETPKKEVVKVNQSLLETSISNLETALSNAKYADASVVANVREALATAKAVLANETAKQEEVNIQKDILSSLKIVLTESNKLGLEKEQADKDKVAKEEAERKATPTEKALSEAKSALDKVSSEADVTNTLAATELRKKEVAPENRPAIEAAVAKNQAVLNESKVLLADKSITKEQVDAQLARLNESILAVYSELKKAGIGRDGKFAVALAAQDFYAERSTGTTHASEINATVHTGKDTYTIPVQEITLTKGAGTDTSGLEVVVYSNQRDGAETNAGNGMHTEQGGATGHNNKGRVDYPLTPEAAKKLAEEAPLWRNKLRADGSKISNAATSIYSAGGGYEYLATEIYRYGYEQGIDRVYIKGLKDRIAVTEAAKQAGWSLTSVTPTNLAPGLAYDEATDTIQGVVSANIENGVYDLRFDVTATHTDGRSVTFRLQNLRAGWVGWQDTTPPKIKSDSATYVRTVGDDANINVRFNDASGAGAIPGNTAGNYSYTTAEGKVITVRKYFSRSVTGVSGTNTTGTALDDSKVLIPGTNYTVSNSTSEEQAANQTNVGKGVIGGELTEAGIYTVSVFAKDYDKLASNNVWNQSGQEAHASLTVVVKPKVEVQNVETYSTSVPVKISKGATSAKVTMPDGTVTNLKAVDGKWLVDSGSTNTAVTENQELGAVDSNTVFNIPVTSEATAKVGVDNITVEASSENVKGTFLREQVELTGTDGQKHIAKLNSTSGHWELPSDYAEVKTPNGDGTTTWTKREVYTEAQQDGAMKFYIYEYTRQLDINGKVTSVDTPTRPLTVYASRNTSQAGDGMSATITYDKHSNTWSSSDGTEVTATKLGENSWEVLTKSGFGGVISGTIATNSDVATVVNTKPTASSQDYTSTKGTLVDLRNEAKAAVAISDTEDAKYGKTTYITRITVTSPSGVQKVYETKQDANNYNLASGYTLNEVGVYTVTVDVIDSNGNYTTDATIGGTESGVDHGAGSSTATTTYHITVTDTIEGHDATSSDIQGATQTGTPTFTSVGDGSTISPSATSPAKLVAADGSLVETLKVANEGTYTINPATGVVTFVPVPTFTGEGTGVTVQATDSNGETATATYKPTVTPITLTGENVTSKNIQGEQQSETPLFSSSDESAPVSNYKLVDPATGNPTTATSVTVENVGTYTIDSTTGVVTFQPVATYTGTPAPVTVQASATITNEKGESTVITGTATYTPTVVPVVPTAKESATAGKQGQAQTSQIVFDIPDTDATTLNFAKGETSEVLGEDGRPKSVALDKSTLTLLDANGNSVTTVTVDGEGTYTLDKTTNVITFQPTEEFTGKATPVRVQIADINGTTVTTTYTPTVVAEDGTVIVEYKDEEGNIISPSTTPVNNEKVTTPFTTEPKEIPGYTLVKVETTNGTVDEGTKKVSGKVTNEPTTVTYTYRKDVQTATISYYDVSTGAEVAIDSAKVPAASVETVEGVYKGTIDFVNREKAIAALEKAGYTLVEDSYVAATTADKLFDNDTAVNQNFKVTVKQRVEPVTPNDEKPVPGQPVNPEDPNSPVWPSTAENLELTKTVTRTIKYRYNDENGEEVTADKVQTVTFTREATVNLVTGEVKYSDWSAAQTLEEVVSPEVANYTYDKKTITSLEVTNVSTDSTVYVIYTPVAPTTTPATSTVIQGKTQTGTPTYKHADGTELKPTTDNPAKFVGTEETTIPATKDGKTVGTYTIDPTGTVTFTPNKDFVGTPDPAKVVVTDPTNGTTVESSYTPTVTPVTPTGVDTGSTGPKNTPQSGTPTFVPGHKDVPMDNTVPATFEDGTTSKTVPNEGTYTVDPTGKVTFTPNKDFVGTATGVTIVRKDTNGTEVKAKYTPTVYEVKSDTQVATVTYKDTNGIILGEVDILQGDSGSEMNYSTAERINALKKLGYELVSDEFTKADGSKQSFDNDTKAIQKFVVTVQPRLVPVIPSDVTPVPGQPIDPEDPNSPVWPESVKELTTSEEVTRTITYVDGDGKEVTTSVTSSVKFTRDAKVNLVTGEVTYGEWKAATTDVLSGNKLPLVKGYIAVSGDIEESTKDQTVKAEDKDIIQKVVYKKLGAWIPNVPGQTNPPRIDYPNDPNGDPTKPGVPTEDIVIPYVPGYIPRDKDGNPLKPVDPEDTTKGYVPPTLPTDPSQDTPINYTKITTSYVTVDPNGKEVSIPNYPTVEGNQPKKDIPGYRFVETKKLPNGDVEHVYEKVTTFFKDKEGNEIPNYPSEPGTVDKKDIPEYRFVETNKLPNGDVEHVYEKVTTFFKDKEGNEIPNYPSEPGTVDKKDIPEYRFVETKKLPNGDVEHVYEKLTPPAPTPSPVPQPNPGKQNTTTWTDENGNPLKPTEPGSKEPGTIPGYEYVKTVTGSNGNIRHIFRKVEMPTPTPVEPVQPVSPQEPETPEQPVTPEMPTVPEQPKQPATPKYVDGQKELPNTGTEANASLAAIGLLGALSGFGLLARKKED